MNHATNRDLVRRLTTAMYNWSADDVRATINNTFAPDATMQLAFPFETMDGPMGWFDTALAALAAAMPDLERRDYIVMGGPDAYGNGWVGCAGYYTGTWVAPFLDIPATGHQSAMRYHEFFRVEGDRIVEMQALWDIPELMMQSGCWPMGPSLGRWWHAPSPATQDGIRHGDNDLSTSQASVGHVLGMLDDMGKHPTEPMEAMRLEHWWHPNFSWYGPVGIGTGRGIDGFRRHHQIPFLKAMPDRRGSSSMGIPSHFFGDGPYVGVTAWPGMLCTVSADGWLGIAPAPDGGTPITMRSLDFWRVENGLIRENWVLVDLLSVWDQLGVDVLARMRELTSRPQIF